MQPIKQGDIWLLDFDPSRGNEIQKTRPALVLSHDYYNLASGTIFVVPLTSQPPKKISSPFHTVIKKGKNNELTSDSYANVSQIRPASKLRFIKKIGTFDTFVIKEVVQKFLGILDLEGDFI